MNRRLELREPPTAAARDLSWKEGGLLVDVAANGTILFHEEGDSGGPAGSAYVRKPSDPEPLRIADGYGVTLANDGSKALVVSRTRPLQLSVVPIAGLAQPIDIGDAFEGILEAAWLKDGRLLLELRSAGQRPRVFVRPAAGGPLAPFLPEGLHLIGSRLLAPDGQRLAVGAEDGRLMICTVPAAGDAACTPVSGLTLDDLRAGWMVAGWSADSRALFLYRRYATPIRVERFDIATGRRELHTTVEPLTAAVSGLSYLLVTPSGAVVYNYSRSRSALYAISGLR
jgi:hypothetical protein